MKKKKKLGCVYFNNQIEKWVAEITYKGRRNYVGSFKSKRLAQIKLDNWVRMNIYEN